MSYRDAHCTCAATYHCGCADHPNINRETPTLPLPVWFASIGTGAIVGLLVVYVSSIPPGFGILIAGIVAILLLPVLDRMVFAPSEPAEAAQPTTTTNRSDNALKRIGKGYGYRLRLAEVLSFRANNALSNAGTAGTGIKREAA